MNIRIAEIRDCHAILGIYKHAREFMKNTGNPNQWVNGYPDMEIVKSDIESKNSYVVCSDDGKVHSVFVFIIGEDPTYNYIEDGSWKNNEPYGTIHRIASDGTIKNTGKICFDFCKTKISNLRADTYKDNKVMKKVLEKNGFEECGIIYVRDKSPRIAYQYVR